MIPEIIMHCKLVRIGRSASGSVVPIAAQMAVQISQKRATSRWLAISRYPDHFHPCLIRQLTCQIDISAGFRIGQFDFPVTRQEPTSKPPERPGCGGIDQAPIAVEMNQIGLIDAPLCWRRKMIHIFARSGLFKRIAEPFRLCQARSTWPRREKDDIGSLYLSSS
jgi:hypothetical protein